MRRFFNYIPIFHLSSDDLFGAYSSSNEKRFSIICIAIGKYKVYIITFFKNKFNFLHVVNFDSLTKIPNQEEVDQKTNDYVSAQSENSEEKIKIQYEFLKEAYNNNSEVKSSLETRVASYMTAYFVLLGFLAYLFNEIWKLKPEGTFKYLFFLVVMAGLFLSSAGIFIWSFLRVKSTTRSTFKDLRLNTCTLQLAASAYTNWYASKGENNSLASHVKNIESNIFIALVISVFLWFFVLQNPTKIATPSIKESKKTHSYLVVDRDGKHHESALLSMLSLKKNNENYDYFVIYGQGASESKIQVHVDILKLYLGAKTPIQLFSHQLDPNNQGIEIKLMEK